MLRLMARLAPVALMAYPLWVYRGHMDDVGRSREWVNHTQAARRLADRIAREAGCDPMPVQLGRTLDEFAATTADNPSQARLAEAMRDALARGEMKVVSVLADQAGAEEDRLLEIRRVRFSESLEKTRSLADVVLACGVIIAVLLAGIDYVFRLTQRRTLRPLSEVEAERGAKDAALARERAAREEIEDKAASLRNRLADAELRLQIYEARYGRDRSYAEMRETIESLRDEIRPPGLHGEGHADDLQ